MVLGLSGFFTAATGYTVYLFSHGLDLSNRLFLDSRLGVGCTDDVSESYSANERNPFSTGSLLAPSPDPGRIYLGIYCHDPTSIRGKYTPHRTSRESAAGVEPSARSLGREACGNIPGLNPRFWVQLAYLGTAKHAEQL